MTDKLRVEEIARRLMILLEKNVCICDCLGCKTSSCLDCSASDSPPWKRWDMCFEQDDDSQTNIEQALLTFAKQEAELLVEALELAKRDIFEWEATAVGLRKLPPDQLEVMIQGTERGEKDSERVRHKIHEALTAHRQKYPKEKP